MPVAPSVCTEAQAQTQRHRRLEKRKKEKKQNCTNCTEILWHLHNSLFGVCVVPEPWKSNRPASNQTVVDPSRLILFRFFFFLCFVFRWFHRINNQSVGLIKVDSSIKLLAMLMDVTNDQQWFRFEFATDGKRWQSRGRLVQMPLLMSLTVGSSKPAPRCNVAVVHPNNWQLRQQCVPHNLFIASAPTMNYYSKCMRMQRAIAWMALSRPDRRHWSSARTNRYRFSQSKRMGVRLLWLSGLLTSTTAFLHRCVINEW